PSGRACEARHRRLGQPLHRAERVGRRLRLRAGLLHGVSSPENLLKETSVMRVVVATLAVVVGLVVLAGAVLIFSGAYYVGADKPHWSSTAWLLTQARDRSIRAHASGIAIPVG